MMAVQIAELTPPLAIRWDVTSEISSHAFEAYHASMADLYDVTGVAQFGRVGFESRTTAVKLGPSALATAQSGAQTLTRTAEQIRRSGLDHISIILNRSHTVGDADGLSVRAPGGAVQFRDLARPSASRVETIDLVNILVPRDVFKPWLGGRSVHGLVLAPASAGGRLVASHIATLASVMTDLSEEDAIAALEATFVIADRHLGARRTPSHAHTEAIYRTVRHRAAAHLDATPSSAKPDIAAIARSLGVSRSSLYRAFEPYGGVKSYLTQRRLDRAFGILRIQPRGQREIAQLAATFGFSSAAHFTKLFRNRFGCQPSDLADLPEPGSGRPSRDGDGPSGPAHHVLLDWLKLGGGAMSRKPSRLLKPRLKEFSRPTRCLH